VRPTEASALTRSLTIDKLGKYPAWAIVDKGRKVRQWTEVMASMVKVVAPANFTHHYKGLFPSYQINNRPVWSSWTRSTVTSDLKGLCRR
jgi:hypothetical protein